MRAQSVSRSRDGRPQDGYVRGVTECGDAFAAPGAQGLATGLERHARLVYATDAFARAVRAASQARKLTRPEAVTCGGHALHSMLARIDATRMTA
jgi:hypothetical protein